MNDAVATQLRQIVDRYGLEVCEDPRRVEALLRDLSGEHRREIAVLVGAAREGLPSELLASRNSALPAVLGERLARKLQENLGLGDEAARWAVRTWASALGISGFAAPAPAGGERKGTRPTVHPGAVDAGIRVTRVLGEATGAVQLITADGRGWETSKPRLLAEIASMLAVSDPDRAARLLDDAERLARSITTEDGWSTKVGAIGDVAKALAGTDPDRALRLARSITDETWKGSALCRVAETASTDPDRAARLLDDVERLARSLTRGIWRRRVLTAIARAVAVTDPDRAARLFDDLERLARSTTDEYYPQEALWDVAKALVDIDPDGAERVAWSITRDRIPADGERGEYDKASVLAAIARVVAATDPDRAARLLDDVERLARSITADAPLRDLAVAVAVTEPDRALRLARSIDDLGCKAAALTAIARVVAATDPDRAARLLDDAERVAQSITDFPYGRAQKLVEIAKAWAEW